MTQALATQRAAISLWQRLSLLWACIWLYLRYRRGHDDWLRRRHPVPAPMYGPGSMHEFDWYLTGDSGVEVGDVEQVCAWLRGCEFVPDAEQFGRADVWQHPVEFERVRRGDCEDHALWAWRKLRALDRTVLFVTGRFYAEAGATPEDHAWILFEADAAPFLLETTVKDDRPMVHPLDEVRHQFVPHFAVGHNLDRYLYGGYLRLVLGEG